MPSASAKTADLSRSTRTTLPVASFLLLVSGTSALVYQVLWIKQLSLVVGVEVHAISAGISAFFAGLALGGWWLGGLADRLQRPVRLYALLELAVAVLGVATTLSLGASVGLFVRLQIPKRILNIHSQIPLAREWQAVVPLDQLLVVLLDQLAVFLNLWRAYSPVRVAQQAGGSNRVWAWGTSHLPSRIQLLPSRSVNARTWCE